MKRALVACVGATIGLFCAPLAFSQTRDAQTCASTDGSAEERTLRAYHCAETVLPQHIDELIFDISVRPRWFDNSNRFWYERHTPDGYLYVYVDPTKQEKRALFDAESLFANLSELSGQSIDQSTFRLRGASLSDDQTALEFGFGDKRYSLDLSDNGLTVLDDDEAEGVLAPDGKSRIILKNHNLWLRDEASGNERQLTHDGTQAVPYATPIVNVRRMIADRSERPEIGADVYWSPNSQFIATHRIDRTAARRLSLMQSTPPEGAMPRAFEYIYSFTGDQNVALATDIIIDVTSGAIVQSNSAPREILYYGAPYYLWDEDSSGVFSVFPGRGYKTLTLNKIDAQTGEVSAIRQDSSDSYVDYYGHHWSYDDANDRLFWTADSTGFAHVYTSKNSSGNWQQITSGDWRARYVAGTSEDGNVAFIVGNGREEDRDPYLRSLYAVDVNNGAIVDLTPEAADHSVSVSPDGRFFVDNISRIDMPTRSVLRDTATGAIVMELQQADISRFTQAGFTLPKPFEAMGADNKTKVYGAIFKPANFDPQQSYPVIEYVYTGPHYVVTPKSFEAALFYRNILSMSQLGAIGVTVDGRGTFGRSRAFQQEAYQNLHKVGMDDHIAAIEQMAQRHSWIDADRVGIYGFSAGGYDVVRAMTRHPDFYKVGVSASGNHDNRLDKAVWNEQWMGSELGPLYDENSNVEWAKHLSGDLFLAHGELDENVPPAATMRLADALIRANKDFEFLIVPGADHFLDSSPYFQRRRFDFFTEHLLEGTPPENYEMRGF